ncbi:geranylgeranylglycerol-phosphate geranylgeranyltransferase [Catalinimonas niigatensis]|uniref:geranylgeranylglycerol-phosphate geranylgeranyltransferase n=1 Tax=Catalinimonas niigatensis TaxID=1397264 RepID=UPI002666DF96|nr:geranylgeranylglycerol-phosphate geranylgeranyltransferase [Catalinimonas niigatensis]WPP48489.1 geranylgeranylglycerol-phosphate geranylgeranyltransferase [Catalinimonas niigatensis]
MKVARFAHQGKSMLTGFARVARVHNLVILALTQYFTAIFLADIHTTWEGYAKDYELFLLIFSTTIIAAGGYLINDYYDIKIDYINKPDRVVVGKVLKRRYVMIAHTLLNLIGIGIGFYLSWKVGAINFMAAFLLWLYSNQLKRLPLIGNLAIAVLSGLAVWVVSIYFPQNQLLVYTYAVFAFAISLVREIIKDIEDMQGDESFGCKTLPILLGVRYTKMFLYFLSALFIFLLFFMSGILGNETLITYFLILTIPITYFIVRLVYADTKKKFGFLSDFCKLLMLSGILSMTFF